jgi:tRNA A37 methylthiotransferase MiaB
VRGPVVNERIAHLRARAKAHSFAFRRQFVGETVELLVEHDGDPKGEAGCATAGVRHGRCERYFAVHFEAPHARPGDFVRVRVDDVSPERTWGSLA